MKGRNYPRFMVQGTGEFKHEKKAPDEYSVESFRSYVVRGAK